MEAAMFVDMWHHSLLLGYQKIMSNIHVKHSKFMSNTDDP